jgi:mitogen-activated protein kinase kinase kinase
VPTELIRVAATFKWLRGEIIGRGNYGKVFLALNLTTGEMIAVKQVEMPRSASDLADQRIKAVVDALKFESATLKDLDHAHIVQYLGVEQTSEYLSMWVMMLDFYDFFV